MGLVFSIAFNSYEKLWSDCIGSHEEYAARHGYAYQLVGKGMDTSLSMEIAWIKIPLLIAALDNGHEWVMFVDSDAAFDQGCPRFETVSQGGKDVFLANGFSGRPNSGVIILRNTTSARRFLEDVLMLAGRHIPKKHDVGWGENGAVIHVASKSRTRAVLDARWNNNHDPAMASHIYHYSAGPMRNHYEAVRPGTQIGGAVESAHGKKTLHPVGSAGFFDGLSELLALSTHGGDLFDIGRVQALLAANGRARPSRLGRILCRLKLA